MNLSMMLFKILPQKAERALKGHVSADAQNNEFEYKGEHFVVKITPASLETREERGTSIPTIERNSWKKRSERSPAPVSMAFF